MALRAGSRHLPDPIVPAGGIERANLYFSLTEALVPGSMPALSEAERATVVFETSEFVRAQVEALPPRLLLLMRVGLTGFRLSIRLRHLRSFCALPLSTRRRVITRWAYGPVPLTRQLFRSLRSTALLAYFEHPTVMLKMSVPPA